MIHNLYVKSIALIDEMNMEFSQGLNVLSGETGAGKSIIVNSMNLILGERADRELIRSGQEKAYVEAILYIDDNVVRDLYEKYEIEPSEELVVSRTLSASGKNVCKINGISVNLNILKEFMDRLVDIHGQHEHQSLLYEVNHLAFIDGFFRDGSVTCEIGKQMTALKAAEKKLNALGGDTKTQEQTAELLEFQVNEIQSAHLYAGEMDELLQERERLNNAQTIISVLEGGYEALYAGEEGTALSVMRHIIDGLRQIESLDSAYAMLLERLEESYYTVEDCAQEMNSLAQGAVFDEGRQDEVEERIAFIRSLQRKYDAAGIQDILDYAAQAEKQLYDMSHSQQLRGALLEETEALKDELYENYKKLSLLRRTEAQDLTKKMVAELADLGIKDAQFEARFAPLPTREEVHFSDEGADRVEFFISTNLGEPLKPLSKTASGGEISRIMLAFKNIAAQVDKIDTIIFDEIDTGLSGKMAHVVAEKMDEIARYRQVICVTHLPQIAAMADSHHLIRKESEKGATVTAIQKIEGEEIIEEIARLSGGTGSEHAAASARELLKGAQEKKRRLRRDGETH